MSKPAFRVAVVLLLCVVASATYNVLCLRDLQSKYPMPGKFYAVNGFPMHLYCTGTGSPTVVLESGLGGEWLEWQRVQPELAKTTRVCSYDRAGIGSSELQPGPRDAKNIATQLHSLLQQAGEAGPVVMVGASAGGFYVRQFVASYPAQVVGVAFVDTSVPEQIQALPGAKDTRTKRWKRHWDASWEWFKDASGWARLSGGCRGDLESGLEAYTDLARAEACRPSLETTWLGEADAFEISAEQAAAARCCGQLPLLIISQDPDRPKPGWTAQQIAAQPIWNTLQENLKRLSPRSRRIIARNSKHHVMIDRPEVVIQGIQHLVLEIRNQVEDPGNGTTVVQ